MGTERRGIHIVTTFDLLFYEDVSGISMQLSSLIYVGWTTVQDCDVAETLLCHSDAHLIRKDSALLTASITAEQKNKATTAGEADVIVSIDACPGWLLWTA